jgi:hypothetical protein
MIINPIGTPPGTLFPVDATYVGIDNGGGWVKVGNRVGPTTMMNWAAREGSIVGVTRGVGVDGGTMIGSSPPEIVTRYVYTQATPPSTVG